MEQVKEESIEFVELEQKYVDTNRTEAFQIKDEMCQIKEETESNELLTDGISIDEKPTTDSLFHLDLVKIEHEKMIESGAMPRIGLWEWRYRDPDPLMTEFERPCKHRGDNFFCAKVTLADIIKCRAKVYASNSKNEQDGYIASHLISTKKPLRNRSRSADFENKKPHAFHVTYQDEMCQIKEETESNEQLTEEVSIDQKPATDSLFNLNLVKIEHQVRILFAVKKFKIYDGYW
ncbi:hypothetical protein C0J52_03111 [Blattella germanica]|nr:hypothetical protein C0J52_03111 [Blattella germanica]